MPTSWLRLILLLGGLLLIAVLVWLERRRPSRVQQGQDYRNERNEPVMGFADEPATHAGSDDDGMMLMSARGPDAGRAPPLIDLTAPATAAAPSREPELISVGDIPAVRTVEGEPSAAANPQPLRVEWPPEGQRQIVSLRIVAARQNRISGRLLRQGLSGAGFQHGEFGIFHLGDDEGRVALSAASLVRPGLLDPAAMDFQSFSGINLFAVLPGPWSNEDTLERLSGVAAELAQRVEGRVQDERGMPFDRAHPVAWRERALAHLTEYGAVGAGRAAQGATASSSHAGPAD
jgi:FtsZ-interacting cell division protein ZipA